MYNTTPVTARVYARTTTTPSAPSSGNLQSALSNLQSPPAPLCRPSGCSSGGSRGRETSESPSSPSAPAPQNRKLPNVDFQKPKFQTSSFCSSPNRQSAVFPPSPAPAPLCRPSGHSSGGSRGREPSESPSSPFAPFASLVFKTPAPPPASSPAPSSGNLQSSLSNLQSPPAPRLLDQLRREIRLRHYSIRTEHTYCDWAVRYVRFHNMRHPNTMGAPEINAVLSHLASDRHVTASTQNQAAYKAASHSAKRYTRLASRGVAH
jgi:hypothetical protein